MSAWHTNVLYWGTGVATKAAQLQHPDSMVGALQQSHVGCKVHRYPVGLERHHFLSTRQDSLGGLALPRYCKLTHQGWPATGLPRTSYSSVHKSFPHICFSISTLLLMYSPFLYIEQMQLEEGKAQKKKWMMENGGGGGERHSVSCERNMDKGANLGKHC